jgi:hypothetical protein
VTTAHLARGGGLGTAGLENLADNADVLWPIGAWMLCVTGSRHLQTTRSNN